MSYLRIAILAESGDLGRVLSVDQATGELVESYGPAFHCPGCCEVKRFHPDEITEETPDEYREAWEEYVHE